MTCSGSPDGRSTRLKVRSVVGLLPCAPRRSSRRRCTRGCRRCGRWTAFTASTRSTPTSSGDHAHPRPGCGRTAPPLHRHEDDAAPDPRPHARRGSEFLSPYGIRPLSRVHKEHPYTFQRGRPGLSRGLRARRVDHRHLRRQLQLAWPGLDAAQRAHHPGAREGALPYYGTGFTVECPTGSGREMNLLEVAREIQRRLA